MNRKKPAEQKSKALNASAPAWIVEQCQEIIKGDPIRFPSFSSLVTAALAEYLDKREREDMIDPRVMAWVRKKAEAEGFHSSGAYIAHVLTVQMSASMAKGERFPETEFKKPASQPKPPLDATEGTYLGCMGASMLFLSLCNQSHDQTMTMIFLFLCGISMLGSVATLPGIIRRMVDEVSGRGKGASR